MSDLKKVNEEISESVTSGFQKIEDGVVDGYKKIESSIVGAFKDVEDKFVGRFLTHEGESVEDAEKRLAAEQAARKEAVGQPVGMGSVDIGRASVEASKKTGKK